MTTRRATGSAGLDAGGADAARTVEVRGGVMVRRCCMSRFCEMVLRDGAAEIVVPFLPLATGLVSTCTVRESRFAFSDAYPSCSRLRACSKRFVSAPACTNQHDDNEC